MLVAAGGWLVGPLLERHETQRADGRLAAALNAAAAGSMQAFTAAQIDALALAASPTLERALLQRDRRAIREFERTHRNVVITVSGIAGLPTIERDYASSAEVKRGKHVLARVDVAVPLARVLKGVEGATSGTVLLITHVGRIVDGPDRGTRLALASARATDVTLSGKRYRALAQPLNGGVSAGSMLVAIAPRSAIEAKAATRRNLLVLASAAMLAAVLLIGWTVERSPRHGRAAQHTQGHGMGRMSARQALALVGDALAATHEPQALLAVILNATIEATGAVGGRLLDDGIELARVGKLPRDVEPLDIVLRGEGGERGLLELFPPRRGFGTEDVSLARSLASQASIALENAHLHRIVERQAATDELTQLANRRAFTDALEAEKRRADRSREPFAVVVADLDDFKRVNDRYGHQTGDSVLCTFARVAARELREVDLPGRIGGEEFAILLPQTSLAGAAALAERIRTAFANERLTSERGEALRATASFGVAVYPLAGSASALLADADNALYRAKARGKNRVATAQTNVAAVSPSLQRRRPTAS